MERTAHIQSNYDYARTWCPPSGRDNVACDPFQDISQAIDGVIALGGGHGIEVVAAIVETIKRKSAATRAKVDISSNSFISIPIVLDSASGIKVVHDRAVVQPVQGDSPGLLRGENVSGCSLVGLAKVKDGVFELCDIDCV